MSRREFQFSEGSSNKFWAIEVDGTSQKVHFGRVGTSGQAQTKVFGSEDEAKKATDKLIAEKVKKGYKEVTTGTKSTGTPMAKVKKVDDEAAEEKPKGKAAKVAEPEESKPTAPLVIPAIAEVTRTIDLEPEDIQKAEWPKKWRPQVRPELRPFDLNQCVEALSGVRVNNYGYWEFRWEQIIPAAMSAPEAQFWLLAMRTAERGKGTPDKLARKIAAEKIDGKMSLEQVVEVLNDTECTEATLVLPLSYLLTPKEIIALIFRDWKDRYGSNRLSDPLLSGFAQYVLPYLSEKELQPIRDEIREKAQSQVWKDIYDSSPVCDLVAHLGLHDELRNGMTAITDTGRAGGSYYRLRFWVSSLRKPEWIESEGRRLKVQWVEPEEVRHWLAATQFSSLDVVRDSILAADSTYAHTSDGFKRFSAKEQAERLAMEFARVKAPEAAPHMLELKLSSKAPSIARQWLDEQVGNAIAGLIPTAAGRGKLADAAIDYLREAKKKGHEKLIRACLKSAAADVAESIKKNVLDFAEKEYAVLDAKSMQAKLKSALEAKAKKGKLPGWAPVSALPPILVGEKKLSDEQSTAVLEALQRSTVDKPDPLVTAIREHADAASLDAFAWKLFQLWQSEGCPPKEKWAMGAIGLLGGDASALKLTPLVRNWPGESQHQRAVFGLECLRAIGSDTALMQLNGIAQKLKFKGLKQKAAEAMEAIAKDKGLTRSQLEDRIVPDCDLDERGSRVFDFGPRQFRFVLGPEMKPMLKDSDGKVKTDLPKPGAKDDTAKAEAAVNDWKLMKKQIKEVANIQAQRLEQAMVTGRRWPVVDFETLLVKHPLMTNLVRLVLWGGYDKKGKLLTTFRVTEDQTYADAKDGECKLKGIDEIGIVHPLNLPDDQKSSWGEVFSDYEIVPPFPQLGRTIYRLEKNEVKEREIKRFDGIKLAAPTLVFGLEKFGWIRGTGQDGGGFDEHSKQFPSCDVTAVVHYEGNVGFGFIDPNEMLAMKECYFVEGIRPPTGYAYKEKSVKLGEVDPVAVSEVLTDLTALAAKGK
jgi:predicted DNA-binding WGR domain protein